MRKQPGHRKALAYAEELLHKLLEAASGAELLLQPPHVPGVSCQLAKAREVSQVGTPASLINHTSRAGFHPGA